MLIVSVASRGRERILQKVSFVQNKKAYRRNFLIDEEQLFLLKNFPSMRGNKGILRQFYFSTQVDFLNLSESLGTYGLLSPPGDMMLVSAKYIDALVKGKYIKLDNLKKLNSQQTLINNHGLFSKITRSYFEEMFYHMKMFGLGNKMILPYNVDLPFMSNNMYSSNISDFVRNWALFNIGETSFAFGRIIDHSLDRFINFVLSSVGMQEYFNIELTENNIFENRFENNLIVAVLNYKLEANQ